MTVIPSGLAGTLGFTQESTPGMFTTSGMRWPQFDKESLALDKKTVQSQGLHGGLYVQSKRRALVELSTKGQVDMDVVDRQLGLLLKHMIGSSAVATQVGASAAYLQTHTPGDTFGLALSAQAGRPTNAGVIQQFNYNGLKILDWTISVQRGGIAKLSLTFDGVTEDTSASYAAVSYVAADILHFAEGALYLGGTVTTTSGVASVSGQAAPTGIIEAVTIKGTNALDVERFPLGSITKKEQLSNHFRGITGDVTLEFANLADAHTAYAADTPTPLYFTLTGPAIGGGNNAFLDVLIPNIFFDADPIPIEGPAILKQKATFTGDDDGANPPIQFQYQSTDTSV